MRWITGFTLIAALMLAGCASSDRVIIDHKNIDDAQYQQDLNDCRQVAGQVSTGRDAGEGAVGGGIIGGLLGAIFGNSRTAAVGAGAGAVVGGAGKAGDAQQEKEKVLKNCMRGRGYRVLN